jgi:hypothetical protein
VLVLRIRSIKEAAQHQCTFASIASPTHPFTSIDMVLAAPLFLVSQTRAFREFYALNKQGFYNIGVAVLASWLSLRLLSKTVRGHGRGSVQRVAVRALDKGCGARWQWRSGWRSRYAWRWRSLLARPAGTHGKASTFFRCTKRALPLRMLVPQPHTVLAVAPAV